MLTLIVPESSGLAQLGFLGWAFSLFILSLPSLFIPSSQTLCKHQGPMREVKNIIPEERRQIPDVHLDLCPATRSFFFKLLPLSEGGGGIQQQHERRGLLSAQ